VRVFQQGCRSALGRPPVDDVGELRSVLGVHHPVRFAEKPVCQVRVN
jgi:hypothetical protein